ncbi:MAG: chemotaxis protein CheW [Gemmatimonadota bacterium]
MTADAETNIGDGQSATELLLIRHGAEYFAVALTASMEAMELPVLTKIPGSPALLLGLLTDRGAGVPVFDASRIFDVDASGRGDEVLVIIRDGERQVGLVVDEIEDVIMVDLMTMQQPMDSMRVGGVVRGVVQSGNRLVAVLDARAIVRMGARALPERA